MSAPIDNAVENFEKREWEGGREGSRAVMAPRLPELRHDERTARCNALLMPRNFCSGAILINRGRLHSASGVICTLTCNPARKTVFEIFFLSAASGSARGRFHLAVANVVNFL